MFNTAMSGNSPAHARLVAAAYDFSKIDLVVDVGGGHGRLLATLLERYPRLRGILFDQPHVIEGARQTLDAAGVVDRCELIGGSFFEAVPSGGDAYVLSRVLHNWTDERAAALLAVPRASILHVGDSWDEDVAGAQAAGLQAVLLDRKGSGARSSINSLAVITDLVES